MRIRRRKEFCLNGHSFKLYGRYSTSNKCIKCAENYNKNYFEKARNKWLQRIYKITLDDYNRMLIEQNYKCKICGIHQSQLKVALNVDHDHKTGLIRGLLCNQCNRILLPLLENKPFVLINAQMYLTSFKEL